MADETNTGINFGEEFDKQEFELLESGKYEVEIYKIDLRKSEKSGKEYLNITFMVRQDVDQKYGGRKLFYKIWKREGDNNFNFFAINRLIITQKNRADYKVRFVDFDEVLLYLQGIHLVITVDTVFDDYSGTNINVVKDVAKENLFEPSVWDQQPHDNKDDLPF